MLLYSNKTIGNPVYGYAFKNVFEKKKVLKRNDGFRWRPASISDRLPAVTAYWSSVFSQTENNDVEKPNVFGGKYYVWDMGVRWELKHYSICFLENRYFFGGIVNTYDKISHILFIYIYTLIIKRSHVPQHVWVPPIYIIRYILFDNNDCAIPLYYYFTSDFAVTHEIRTVIITIFIIIISIIVVAAVRLTQYRTHTSHTHIHIRRIMTMMIII